MTTATIGCVLLIDDNEADNFFHRLAIEEAGCVERVVDVESAAEALELLRGGTVEPDLVFLDINMPAMNGWEFLEAYEAFTPEHQRPTVVLLSTSSAPGDLARAEREYLCGGLERKPMTTARFRQIVDGMVSPPGGVGA